jgi:hypothetical protein
MASLGAAVVTQASMDSGDAKTLGAAKLQFLRVALLAIAIAEAYDFFGDCAWIKDLSTKWSLYVVNTEQTRYKVGFYGGASDFTASYVRNPADDTMLGWPCWPNSTFYAQEYGSSEPTKPIVDVNGDMLCGAFWISRHACACADQRACNPQAIT